MSRAGCFCCPGTDSKKFSWLLWVPERNLWGLKWGWACPGHGRALGWGCSALGPELPLLAQGTQTGKILPERGVELEMCGLGSTQCYLDSALKNSTSVEFCALLLIERQNNLNLKGKIPIVFGHFSPFFFFFNILVAAGRAWRKNKTAQNERQYRVPREVSSPSWTSGSCAPQSSWGSVHCWRDGNLTLEVKVAWRGVNFPSPSSKRKDWEEMLA